MSWDFCVACRSAVWFQELLYLNMTMTPHIMHWRAAHTASLDISALKICKGMGNQRNPSHKTLPNITVMPFPMPNMKKNTLDKASYDVYVVVSRSSWKKSIGWISSKMVHAEHEKTTIQRCRVKRLGLHILWYSMSALPPPPFCINLLTCTHLKNWTQMTVLTLLRNLKQSTFQWYMHMIFKAPGMDKKPQVTTWYIFLFLFLKAIYLFTHQSPHTIHMNRKKVSCWTSTIWQGVDKHVVFTATYSRKQISAFLFPCVWLHVQPSSNFDKYDFPWGSWIEKPYAH